LAPDVTRLDYIGSSSSFVIVVGGGVVVGFVVDRGFLVVPDFLVALVGAGAGGAVVVGSGGSTGVAVAALPPTAGLVGIGS
jgi:hypothetical protein